MREFEIPRVEIPEIHMPEMNFGLLTTGPRLGISADDLTKQLAENLGVAQGSGVLVLEVTPGSPAEKAGLKAGDVIVRLGDEKLSDRSDLARILENKPVAVTIVRNKSEQTLSVQLEQPRGRPSIFRRAA